MLFNSIPFLILFLFTYLLYWNIDDKYKKYVLAGSSFLFYLYYDVLATVHFFTVIAVNFYFSEHLPKPERVYYNFDGIAIGEGVLEILPSSNTFTFYWIPFLA